MLVVQMILNVIKIIVQMKLVIVAYNIANIPALMILRVLLEKLVKEGYAEDIVKRMLTVLSFTEKPVMEICAEDLAIMILNVMRLKFVLMGPAEIVTMKNF